MSTELSIEISKLLTICNTLESVIDKKKERGVDPVVISFKHEHDLYVQKHLLRDVFCQFVHADRDRAQRMFQMNTQLQKILNSVDTKTDVLFSTSSAYFKDLPAFQADSTQSRVSAKAQPSKPPFLEKVTDELLEKDDEDSIVTDQDPMIHFDTSKKRNPSLSE